MPRLRTWFARAAAPLAVAALVASSVPLLETSARAQAVTRSSGPERITTAVAASSDHWAGATDALLATAGTFPDALSAAPLATALGAPLLLTREESLPREVAGELRRLGVERVWLLGGIRAIGDPVRRQLEREGYEVERLAGSDRFETAKLIALEAGPADTGEAVVVLGHHPDEDRAWPDAVAAGALGASPDQLPLLLTAPDRLPGPTEEALESLEVDTVVLVGGDSAVSPGVEDRLRDLGYDVRRISGESRYDTSVALAREALYRGESSGRRVVFATGGDFPDALAAGALAGKLEGPLVLVPSSDLVAPVEELLRANRTAWAGGIVVGGSAAASDFLLAQLDAAVTGAPPPERESKPRVVGAFEGTASWYGAAFHGRSTASGEPFDMHALTAAHRSLPFDTRLRVTNTANGRQVIVRVNDRGPFSHSRVLDLSRAAAEEIGMISSGTARVRAEILED